MTRDVLVLGGGIIGLSCAFEAARKGMRVTVVESGAFGGQASGAAAGMLAPFSENTDQPDAFFRLCLASLRRYPNWLADVEEAGGLSAEWVACGSLGIITHDADALPALSRIRWQNEWGAAAELVEGAALRELEPRLSEKAAAAVYTPGESHVYAPKLAKALEAACRALQVRLLDHAGQLTGLAYGEDGATVRTANLEGELRADKLVVCTGAWTGLYERWAGCPLPVHPIRGQICSFEVPFGEVRHMIFSPQAYWVGKQNGRLVCGASEDAAGFETAVTERGIGRLIRSGERLLPFLRGRETAHRWAGLRPATPDGMPLLGCVPGARNVIVAAGHHRNGILLSPITAHLVGGLLDGVQDEAELAPFAPGRFRTAAATGRHEAG